MAAAISIGGNMKRRIAIAMCAFMMLGSLVTGCGKKTTSEVPDEITIGFAGTLSGDNALVGQYQKDAIKVVENELAQNDGCIEIMGKQVKVNIVLEDTEGKPDICANVYRKFIDEYNAVAIVGPNESAATLAAAPIAQEVEVPVVAGMATNEAVTKVGDYVFRACYLDPFQGKVLARYSYNDLGAKTAAVLFSSADAYSKCLKDAFVEEFESLGGQVVASEEYAGADVKDFNAQLVNINAADPDVLLMPNQVGELALQIKQAVSMGTKAKFIGGDSWDLPTLVEVAGAENMEGAYYVSPFTSSSTSEACVEWVKEYNEVAGENPGSHATIAYEAMKIVLSALENVQTFDGPSLRDAIFATDLDLPSGHVTMNEQGDPIKDAVILQYHDGVGEFVTTVSGAE